MNQVVITYNGGFLMYTFEEIPQLPTSKLQKVLNEISDNLLIAHALDGVSTEIKKSFFYAMPTMRQLAIVDAFQMISTNVSKSKEAQATITSIANKLFP